MVAREEAPGDKRLVAHVVPSGGECAAGELREHLRKVLPEYMVPSAFVLLEALPLSPNGKVDREALPAPERRDAAAPSYVAPRSEAERAVAGVWSEVLRVSEVGIHDNFFSLGGDSILAIQVVGRMRRAGLHVEVREMFEHQTVAEPAEVARGASAALAEQGQVVGVVAVTPIQRWLLEGEPVELHHFNQALMWKAAPSLTAAVVASALEAVVRQHDVLRLRYRRSEGGWSQGR